VTWEDVPENFTSEKIRRVKTYFQQKYNAKNVQIVTKVLTNIKNTKLNSLEATDNILDSQYQKTLMKDFIKENNINIKWELVDRLDNRVNSEIDKLNENKIRYNKWFIKKIEFSNFLSFGNNNVIDFTSLDGITVIESTPKNFGGKSTSSVDLLMFLFFNTTTKTKTNAEIFNKFTDVDEVKVRGEVNIDGHDYIIERKSIRKKTKLGEHNVTTKLEFSKIKEDGTVENLTGEQRRETETFIESAIGTEEDFLSTILTTGYNLEELIESKPTARGQILTKFLGLESLKIKEERAKEIFNDWNRKLVSNTYNLTQLGIDNDSFAQSIDNSTTQIEILTTALTDAEARLERLENEKDLILSSRNNDIDKNLINTNPTLLQREIDTLKTEQKKSQALADNVNVTEPSEFYDEDTHQELNSTINNLKSDLRIIQNDISKNQKLITQLETGSICPTCNRSLDEVDHSDEIEAIKNQIKDLQAQVDELNKNITEKNKALTAFINLKSEYETYERNKLIKARYELEVGQKQLDINGKQTRLNNYENNKKKLEENQKIDADVIRIRTQIETANADIKQNNTNIERHRSNISLMTNKIATNEDLIKKIKAEEELSNVFKVYLTIYGKNGISKVILKNMIPLLNEELYRLLIDSCYFILEMNINDKNEVEFIMIDTESRIVKPLNSGSGYERTIASLAIRSVLTKISSLPKPNIVVMDEVFGKVADENLELVGEFFKKIKNYFEHIFVISHNPLIRNWSDNLIMIKKEDNISSIDFITTKIS